MKIKKNIIVWLYAAFRSLLKKKNAKKCNYSLFLAYGSTLLQKKNNFPASCDKFNPGCWCPRAIFYAEKKIVENF